MQKKLKEVICFSIIKFLAVLVLLFLALFLYTLFTRGISVINLEFLTQSPRKSRTECGICPAILGTFYLSVGAILLAFPTGVITAIYLIFYAPQNYLTNLIRLSINNLAGTPSVVFGLFGFAFFVKFCNLGVSIISGCLTLSILVLPIIIRTTEESLKTIPKDFIEASYAVGATKFQTILNVILPSSFSGILTGVILSIARAAGETAPILFTAACFYITHPATSIFDETQALPFHIYALMTEGTFLEKQTRIANGSVVVLLLLIFLLNSIAMFLRFRYQRSKKW